jgi:hypothetical protein
LCANELLLAQRYGLHRGGDSQYLRGAPCPRARTKKVSSRYQVGRATIAPESTWRLSSPMANRSAYASVLSADAVARKETH